MSDAVDTVSSFSSYTPFKENTSDSIPRGAETVELLGELSPNFAVAVKEELNNLGSLGAERSSRVPKISKNSSKQQSMLSVAGRGRVMDGRTFVLDGHVPWQSESIEPRGQVGQWLPWNSVHKVDGASFSSDLSQKTVDKKSAGQKRSRQENSAFPYQPPFCSFIPPYSSAPSSSSVPKPNSDDTDSSKSNHKSNSNRLPSEKDAFYGEFNLHSGDNDTKAPENAPTAASAPQTLASQRSTGNAPAPRFKVIAILGIQNSFDNIRYQS